MCEYNHILNSEIVIREESKETITRRSDGVVTTLPHITTHKHYNLPQNHLTISTSSPQSTNTKTNGSHTATSPHRPRRSLQKTTSHLLSSQEIPRLRNSLTHHRRHHTTNQATCQGPQMQLNCKASLSCSLSDPPIT